MNKSKGWITALALAAAMGSWAQDRDGEGGGMDGGGPGSGAGRWHHERGHEDGLGMGPMNPRVLRELGFTPEQERKFKEQRLAFEKKKIQLHSDRAMLELDLRNVLSTYPVNQAEAVKIGEKISELEKKAVMLRVEGFTRFLGGLTAEQHRKLMDLQAELREKHRAWREEGGDKDGGPGKDSQ
jgi:Spy/CpxP family protein refolding chaperone